MLTAAVVCLWTVFALLVLMSLGLLSDAFTKSEAADVRAHGCASFAVAVLAAAQGFAAMMLGK